MTTGLSQERLVRKEVALGTIRAFEPPQDHIGTRLIAPWKHVESDDVIFSYTRGMTAGLAPARAEDAESEMAGKDDSTATGAASLIDWAIKDHYDASDVSRYREGLIIKGIAGATSLPLTVDRMTDEWQNKLARDARVRRRMLDNRFEWMIMQALETNAISYSEGKVIFDVEFGRPDDQTDMVPTNGLWSVTASADPIEDIGVLQQDAKDTYGVDLNRAIMSTRVFRSLKALDKWPGAFAGVDPNYSIRGWSDEKAKQWIADQTGIDFILYDSVYRTRPLGSNTITNTRFLSDNKVYFLPSQADIEALDDDVVGFAATLTSPHPEANWQSGFYEWERSTVDPWGYDVGTGVKGFPVFPHLDKTYTLAVLA
ncbi:MAG: major capsid protein [Porticoccaceae bacterium]